MGLIAYVHWYWFSPLSYEDIFIDIRISAFKEFQMSELYRALMRSNDD